MDLVREDFMQTLGAIGSDNDIGTGWLPLPALEPPTPRMAPRGKAATRAPTVDARSI